MEIMQEIIQSEPQMIADRRFLHRHPELSRCEFDTTEFIRKRLMEWGIEIEPLPLHTGLSAIIHGAGSGKTICIRHDIDALPIQEESGLDFSSQVSGVSHACGHDIHSITALYAAKMLQERRNQLAGTVRIVFQPAEEDGTGAKTMIDAGIMNIRPVNDIVIGLHTHPFTTAGDICLRKGPMEAGSDVIKITVKGKKGHGAYPHHCIDPIMTSAFLLSELQAVVSRENEAVKPTILTFGSIHGGTVPNVIPDIVEIMGTMRTFYPECRQRNLKAIERITKCVCESMRAEGTVECIGTSLAPIYNDDVVADTLITAAEKILGEGHVVTMAHPSPGSDDFGVLWVPAKVRNSFWEPVVMHLILGWGCTPAPIFLMKKAFVLELRYWFNLF